MTEPTARSVTGQTAPIVRFVRLPKGKKCHHLSDLPSAIENATCQVFAVAPLWKQCIWTIWIMCDLYFHFVCWCFSSGWGHKRGSRFLHVFQLMNQMVEWWLALSPHSEKVQGSNPRASLCGACMLVLWGILSDMHVRLTGQYKCLFLIPCFPECTWTLALQQLR